MLKGEGMEVKRAVAFVIYEDPSCRRFLAVRRPPDDEDLPNVWGLPAGSLRPGESWEAAVQRAGREKLGVELRIRRLLNEGSTQRRGYTLHMRLYEVEIAAGCPMVPQEVPGITQYVACRWATPELLQPAAMHGSLCSQLFLQERSRRSTTGRLR